MIDYFPLSTASGFAFCNRTVELRHLTRNIELGKPTLVMSPRRYGKTSLVLRAFEQHAQTLFTKIDFYKELTEEDIERAVINGIGQLLGKIESQPKQLLRLASNFFSDMSINVVFTSIGMSVEINDRKRRPADNIQHALEKLHDLATKKNVFPVIFIDEFQRLKEITNNYAIEAAIRHVAQVSKNVTYIFSGSNRHLVEDMFFDSKRPFYKMCDTLHLGRIANEHYVDYIQTAAHEQWNAYLSEKSILRILELTENHPYYVNLLCSMLWRDELPTENMVDACWDRCANENRSQIEKEIDLFTVTQKKLFISLARYGSTDKPTGTEFTNKVKMPSTTISQALNVLVERDYVYKNQDGYYCILDPLQKAIFA